MMITNTHTPSAPSTSPSLTPLPQTNPPTTQPESCDAFWQWNLLYVNNLVSESDPQTGQPGMCYPVSWYLGVDFQVGGWCVCVCVCVCIGAWIFMCGGWSVGPLVRVVVVCECVYVNNRHGKGEGACLIKRKGGGGAGGLLHDGWCMRCAGVLAYTLSPLLDGWCMRCAGVLAYTLSPLPFPPLHSSSLSPPSSPSWGPAAPRPPWCCWGC